MAALVLKAAILVVSDTASRDPSTDKCTDVIKEVFKNSNTEAHEWEVAEAKIAPDNVIDIQRTVMWWADGPDRMSLVITSGGTGFAEKDHTPEVWLRGAFERQRMLKHLNAGSFALVAPQCAWACVSVLFASTINGTVILTTQPRHDVGFVGCHALLVSAFLNDWSQKTCQTLTLCCFEFPLLTPRLHEP